MQRDLWSSGHVAYIVKSWSEMVELMESGLKELYLSLDGCRDDCAGPLRSYDTLGLAQVNNTWDTAWDYLTYFEQP